MFRFSIRDVLWLTVVVGLAVGWRVDYSNQRKENHALRAELEQTKIQKAFKLLLAAKRLHSCHDNLALRNVDRDTIVQLQGSRATF